MAIRIQVKGFKGGFATKNTPGKTLQVSTADVIRAAATVGGPVKGDSWRRTQRRSAIVGTVLSSLVGKTRSDPLRTSTLYSRLEATEKGGASVRLGMAFAAIAAEKILAIRLLEHLNSSNSLLSPKGGKQRADLFGLDPAGDCHVIEAKARANGYDGKLVEYAKAQAANVTVVNVSSGRYSPVTRSASVADLSVRPISVLLEDPPEETGTDVYEIDLEEVIAAHYSVVPDLLALRGEGQKPPLEIERDVVGAYLPGMDVWFGVDRALYGESELPWRERILGHGIETLREADGDRTSFGPDGHVLQLGPDFTRIYESWQERGEAEEEFGEAPSD